MQFIKNGPDIPNELLQAHEEGRVVFFCGAGISIPAGLPSFTQLVEKIYELNGVSKSDSEEATFKAGQLDSTLDQLERRIVGGRKKVRDVLPEILTPAKCPSSPIKTHQALLQLSLSRDGHLRLITTNYDRLFHEAAKKIKMELMEYDAPFLPIPKKSRWNGLVFLHGVLPQITKDADLNNLVMTSGDFGLAYLTERWASRFVTELFRNYVVVFVGYSINDSVLRYMLDALAADRRLGENTPQAWAFAACPEGEEDQKKREWDAKGVRPILYSSDSNHVGLHKSLQAWAEAYTSGIGGKENLVVELSVSRPQYSTRQDDFVGRMLWALSDPSGLPAKRFAEFKPTPSLDWFFEVFTKNSFSCEDLPRFGITSSRKEDSTLKFSLLNRPASHEFGAWMNLTCSSVARWDEVFFQLAKWLTFYLDDPKLILWFSEQGGCICPRLRDLFLSKLDEYHSYSKTEAEKLKKEDPFSIPSPWMEKLWRTLLSGRMNRNPEPFYRENYLKKEGMTSIVRVDLRKRLAGMIILRKPFFGTWEHLDCEPVLKDEEVVETIRGALPEVTKEDLLLIISELELALKDALDLILEIKGFGYCSDISYLHLPSVEEHPQNRNSHNWVLLVELLRDCWLKLLEMDNSRATQRISEWIQQPHLAFKRLALFAASKNNILPSNIWVTWLLENNAYFLWASETKRETCRLLTLQGYRLDSQTQRQLESAILQGPPRKRYSKDLPREEWKGIKEYAIWLRLIKLKSSGTTLGSKAVSRFKRITESWPAWKIYKNQKEEFSHCLSVTGDPDFNPDSEAETPPANTNELIEWLRKWKDPNRIFFQGKWRDACLNNHDVCLLALITLARKNEWPIIPWQLALQVFSEGQIAEKSWKTLAPFIVSREVTIPHSLFSTFTSWLESVSKIPSVPEKELLTCCRILLATLKDFNGTSLIENNFDTEDAVLSAINNPVGHLASAIIKQIYKRELNDGGLLSVEVKEFLDLFCTHGILLFVPARVILASHLINLFRIDPKWTEKHLISFFDWKTSCEASALWQGFLWSPRLYLPLLHRMKTEFFETANHTKTLGRWREQYSTFLTFLALTLLEEIPTSELREAFRALKREDLEAASQALLQAFKSTDKQKEVYWDSRVRFFIQKIWPKSMNLVSSRVAENFAQVSIAAGNKFPEALKVVQPWIPSVEDPSMVIGSLEESNLCKQFSEESLSLLDSLITEMTNPQRFWAVRSLKECLRQISAQLPEIKDDKRFKRLDEFLRRRSV